MPTNAQLVLRLLRNAEHHNHPIPPAPTEDDLDDDDDDGSSDSSGDEEDGHADDGDDETGKSKKVMRKMSRRAKKTKDGVRAKARRAWDKLGEVKEQVSAGATSQREAGAGLMAELRGGHWTPAPRPRGQSRGA